MTLQKGAFDLSWVKTSEGGVNYDDKKYLSSAFKIYNELYYHLSKIVNFAITHWPSQSEAKRTVGPSTYLLLLSRYLQIDQYKIYPNIVSYKL